MPNDLQARLLVDTSDYKAGMADAASATQVLKTARASLAEAELAFGRAAAQGNQQAAAALAEYSAAAQRAEAQVSALGAAEMQAAVAKKASAEAARAASQAYQSSYSELRVLSGSMYGADRAAAQLLSRLPALQTAMQASFAAFGLAALVMIIEQVGKALYDAFDMGGARARKLQEDIRGVNNELDHSLTSLNVQIDKLQQEQAQLEHKPFNGAKLVLDEAAEAAQNLSDRLDGVIKRELEVMKDYAPSAAQTAVAGFTGPHQEETMLREHNKWLGLAKTMQDELNESTSYGNQLHQRLNDLLGKQAKVDVVRSLPGIGQAADVIGTKNYTKEIAAVNTLIEAQGKERAAIQATIELNKQQGATQHAHDVHGATGIGNSAAEALMRAAETRFAELHTKLPEQAIAFWKQYVGAFQQGSAEYLRVIEQVNHYTDEFEKGLSLHSKAVESYQAEQKKLADLKPPNLTEVNKWLTEVDEDLTRTGERWRQYHTDQAKATEDAALAADALRRQSVSFELANGAITRVGAAQRLAAIDADEYRVKLEALKQILEELKREGAGLEPGNPEYAKNQTQQAQVQNQITQLQGQGALTGQKDQSNTAQAIAAPYTQGFQMVGDAWMRVQQQILTSHKSFSQAMAQQAGSMVLQMMEGVEKWALRWAEAEMRSIALHSVSNQIKVGSDQVAAAQSNAIKLEQGAKEALIDAKNAAVAGWKAGMALPFPENVVMAPALAAVGLAGALAQFEVGTNFVPKTGVAMIHEGERIVPRADNEKLMNALGAGGAGGNSFHSTINYHSHVGSASANELSTAMARRLSRMQAVMPRR